MDLEAARALVPWWVLPSAALTQAAAAFLGAFALGAALFRFARRAHRHDAPWPLRARSLYPSRVALLAASWAVPLSLAVAIPIIRGPFLGGADLVALAAAAGAAVALVHWRRRLVRLIGGRGWTLRRSLAAMATRVLVMYPHLWTALAFALAMPARFGPGVAILLAVSLLVLFLLVRGAGFRIACALGLAPAAPEEIARAVGGTAERAGIPLAGIHVIDLPEANAYALPFSGRIGFTRAALGKLDFRSLLAISEHELAHVTEPAHARRTRMAGLLVLVPILLLKPLYGTGGLTAVLLGVLLALLVAKLVRRRLAALETRADEGAKSAEPEAGVYARALAEMYRINLVPAVMRGTVHPHLYDRLIALGAAPDYPRPRPPSRAEGIALMCLVTLCTLALALWGPVAALPGEEPWVAIMLDGGGVRVCGRLAQSRHVEGRYEEAATLYGAAAVLAPGSPRWPAYRAMSLAAAGQVDRATEALLEAVERAKDSPEACGEILAEAQRRIDRAR